jgi:hypothetical protein
MNVFELAAQYRQLAAMVDADLDEITDDALLEYWLKVGGDLNTKMENIGFAIRNCEAVLHGKRQAIMAMEETAAAKEKEINRLKALAINLLKATGQKNAGGDNLKLSIVPNPQSVEIQNEKAIPPEYLRVVDPVPAWYAPDKKQIAADMKLGVIVPGATLVQSVRLAIK